MREGRTHTTLATRRIVLVVAAAFALVGALGFGIGLAIAKGDYR